MTKNQFVCYMVSMLCLVIGLSFGIFIEREDANSDKIQHVDPCEDAMFQRTLSFKLDDWEMRARKKLGDQWSCYEIGETEKTYWVHLPDKIRVVFVLKKKEEAIKGKC